MDNFNNQQNYGQPQMQQPYGQPQMQQPYGQPQMQQPYGQPQMQQPYGQPQMQRPYGQPQMQRPYGQPQMQQPYGYIPYGNKKTSSFDLVFLFKIISTILIFISPILSWYAYKAEYRRDTFKDSANLFKLNSDEFFDKGAMFTIFAILIMLSSLAMLVFDFSTFSPAIDKVKKKMGSFNIDYLFLIVFVIIFIALFFEPTVFEEILEAKDEISEEKLDGDITSGYCNHGLGPIFMLVGLGVRLIADIIESINKKRSFR